MATKTTVELVDDLDGSTAEESVQFSIDGVTYEIDLNHANAEKLREELEPYRAASRRTGGRRTGGPTSLKPSPSPAPTVQKAPSPVATSGSLSSADRAAIRRWAARKGFSVGKIGRIARSIEMAWVEDGRPDA